MAAWALPVCVLLVLGFAIASTLVLRKRDNNTSYADWNITWQDLVQSSWNHHERVSFPLLVARVAVAVFCAGVVAQQLFHAWGNGNSWPLAFFTVWNFIMLTGYFCLGSFFSIQAYRQQGPYRGDSRAVVTSKGRIMLVLFEVSLPMTFLVDVVLWVILYPTTDDASFLLEFTSIVQHGVNAGFMLAELAMNRLTLRRAHVLFVVLWACLYAVFAWIMHAAANFYAYDFLDTSVPEAPLWYVGLLVAHVLFYALACALSWAKERWLLDTKDAETSLLPADTAELAPSSKV
eukprot:CAMPEP_0205831824 /NCGR_PEP_ID=MMETSP0206-20130828/45250_1 /ASSEMBLY_ACC=CAM_ASM_000279 /TAXON_ID=36767 /ORGANISM="Euplotes focardii, Strain TN1" /LENGTH=289 /DNA_ID=CAMNT_0053136821 /DNA_START=26 /DNA_END=895 /DNA_ORIENTATION=-